MSTSHSHYVDLLAAALAELATVVGELLGNTEPSTPLPRPRFFYFTDETVWPCQDGSWVRWDAIVIKGLSYPYRLSATSSKRFAQELVGFAGYQPRRILRTLRRIQAATAWCRARAEGRRRMAQEILRQQEQAIRALEAEAALAALGRN